MNKQIDDGTTIPLNTKVEMYGIEGDTVIGSGAAVPMGGMDILMLNPNINEHQTFTIVPTSNDRVIIRATNANFSPYDYVSIINDQAAILRKREDATEFVISNISNHRFEIRDVNSSRILGAKKAEGENYYVIFQSPEKLFYWNFKKT